MTDDRWLIALVAFVSVMGAYAWWTFRRDVLHLLRAMVAELRTMNARAATEPDDRPVPGRGVGTTAEPDDTV